MSFSVIEKKFLKKMTIIFIVLVLVLMYETFLSTCLSSNSCFDDSWYMGWGIIGYPVGMVLYAVLSNLIDVSKAGPLSFWSGFAITIFSVLIEFGLVGFLIGWLVVGIKRIVKKIKLKNFSKK